MRRTLQTSSAASAPAIARLGGSKRLVVLPQLQGASGAHQNATLSLATLARPVRRSKAFLSSRSMTSMRSLMIGRARLASTVRRILTAADDVSLEARAQWIRQYLRGRPEQEIALVAHGDILRRMIGDLDYVRCLC